MNTTKELLRGVTKTKFVASVLLVAVIVTGTYMVPSAKSKNRSYSSGDAISYNGKLIVASTDMGSLELFSLTNTGLRAEKSINSFDARYGNFDSFYSVALKEENNKLFAYTVDGRYLYKYDISNIKSPSLVARLKDTSWNYWTSLRVVDNRLVTIGGKSIQVWNDDMQVIDSFKSFGEVAYNYNFSPRGHYIYSVDAGKLEIFNTKLRLSAGETKLTGVDKGNHRSMSRGDYIYSLDKKSLKKIDFEGKVAKSYALNNVESYDVVPAKGGEMGYYSIGSKIVKFDLETLKPTKSVSSTGWAMGLKNISTANGEYLVAFSGDYLTVYNGNLKRLGMIKSHGSENRSWDDLNIKLDKNIGAVNSEVAVMGQGFALREPITISFAGKNFETTTSADGKFKQVIRVPQYKKGRTDVKVTGDESGLTYSTTFDIQ